MRHNQNNNGRRFRGRNNGTGQGGGGGNHQTHTHHNNAGGGNQRRVNPRMQTFDSNGPDVRIRGTAYQITEKYIALARDATSSGDRVLAESYLQHAEHYQRSINEMTEEYNKYNPPLQQQQPQHGQGQGQDQGQDDDQQQPPEMSVEQPHVALNDLDQGFLVGNRSGARQNSHSNNRNNQGNQQGNNSHGDNQGNQQGNGQQEEGAQVQRTTRAPAAEPVG